MSDKYILNDPVSRAIRSGVTGVGEKIGETIYKTFPKQKANLDKVADWGSKKRKPIAKMIADSIKSGKE